MNLVGPAEAPRVSPIIAYAPHSTRFARLAQNIQRQAHEPPPAPPPAHRPPPPSPPGRPVLHCEKRPPGARDKSAAVEMAKTALIIALRSGLASPSDMLNISECSREACRLCRHGRTFHVKVTANTPLYVWSPPSPPPPLVGASRPWGESDEGATTSPPPRFARSAGTGGLRGSFEAPSLGGRRPGRGRPLVRTGAGIDENATRLSDDSVAKGAKSSAGIARGLSRDPRLGDGARAEKGVAPLRVSHITWDRRALFCFCSFAIQCGAADAMRFDNVRCQAIPCNVRPYDTMPCRANLGDTMRCRAKRCEQCVPVYREGFCLEFGWIRREGCVQRTPTRPVCREGVRLTFRWFLRELGLQGTTSSSAGQTRAKHVEP